MPFGFPFPLILCSGTVIHIRQASGIIVDEEPWSPVAGVAPTVTRDRYGEKHALPTQRNRHVPVH
jgi:hypothetical protein